MIVNKCLSEEVDGNYESNYDDDDDNLDNNHCLPLSILLMKLNVEEHFNIDVISLLNTTHQWFKAEDGVGCSETTREISFCDLTDSPFYKILCWCPLRTDDGSTICVIDREPRDSFSKKDRESFKEFAKVVMRELEL
ncbi:hypothetical protein RhiirC2_852029 [Rhizophagus irregularis]|uniref:GAF domain-containing protein n=1 Tax=Rhizophagus irregularis TaxID=588596 RepID=A0A2N1N151_9GLOM|nr:hypothetical protein RhiirC2_852029 [Rhizophagus irregularis]